MKRIAPILAVAFGAILALASPVRAQGTIPIALQQSVNNVGQPLAGCLLYIFQVGTVSTPQSVFSDPSLSLASQIANPLVCDQNGRLPMFYLASGSVKVRLTDSSGVVQFEYPSMLVIGPVGGGGGGGGAVDPTTIASTGDIKFRPTGEILVGWVKLNGTTIGPPSSGAAQRANNDVQSLFTYLWNNCASPSANAHCVVSGGLGANANADWQSGTKTITTPDWRSRSPLGLADMGSTSCSGVRADCLLAANVTSGGSDSVTTPGATGGESNHTLTVAQLAAHNHTATATTSTSTVSTDSGHTHGVTDPTHTHVMNGSQVQGLALGGTGINTVNPGSANTGASATGVSVNIGAANISSGSTSTTNVTVNSNGSTSAFNNLSPFMLGTFYMKL